MMSNSPQPSVDQQIGQRIRTARQDAAMTQSDLGRELGCSSQQVHKYERGSNRVSAGTLFVIAQLLGQRVDWFFIDADAQHELQAQNPFALN